MVAKHSAQRLSVGLPSLRIESFSVELMELLEKGAAARASLSPPKRLPTVCAM